MTLDQLYFPTLCTENGVERKGKKMGTRAVKMN